MPRNERRGEAATGTGLVKEAYRASAEFDVDSRSRPGVILEDLHERDRVSVIRRG